MRPAKEEILLVKGDETGLANLAYNFVQRGFEVQKAKCGTEALNLTRKLRPDLVLLDLMLPGEESGISVCEMIRGEDRDVLIIMVVPEDVKEEDKVKAFEAGADDCVTEPFDMKALAARINAKFKRSPVLPGTRGKILEVGDLRLDTKNYTARVKDDPLYLRPMEFKLVAALASSPGKLKTRAELAKEVWEHAEVSSSCTIRAHIQRIRRLLADKSDYEYIHTHRGLGYRFEVQPRS